MQDLDRIRQEVWLQLQSVAFPDSRFHWDFTAFVPDYAGSEECTRAIQQTKRYQQSRVIMVTPDNNLASLRSKALDDGKLLVVPTYAIGRGFWQIARQDVPKGQEDFSATLDGMEKYARPFPIEHVLAEDRPTLMVTGASVLNLQGVRLSPSPSYFDLEWLILSSLGIVDQQTPIFAAVHDCQVVDCQCDPEPFSVVADWIITPTQAFPTRSPFPRPESITAARLPWHLIKSIPLLRTIYEQEFHHS